MVGGSGGGRERRVGVGRRGKPRPGGAPRVRVKAWVSWPDGVDVGPGRMALLEAIERNGSIRVAAGAVGIAYRTAWNWIRGMNAAAGRPLVVAKPGGLRGGGAELTPAGRVVIEALTALDDRVARLAAAATAEFAARWAGAAGRLSHRGSPPRPGRGGPGRR